ncbi:MAG: DUF3822 family protein [Saprospiraceae bacterium]|nr:DUF3822 family protein [Saprospiraceae bacterium]MBP7679412.1 DUF3822 family protein [Saprospiraceae bacterium]
MLTNRDFIIDKSFNQDQAANLSLFAVVGEACFDYCVMSPHNSMLLLKSYALPHTAGNSTYNTLYDIMEQAVKADSLLKYTYQKVHICVQSPKFTLVPQLLYNSDNRATYLNHLTQIDHQYAIFADAVPQHECQNIYATDIGLLDAQNVFFPNSKIYHHITVLLAANTLLETADSEKVIINVRGQTQQLFAYRQGQLLFCNHFAFFSTNDFIYNVLLLFDRFNFNTEKTPIYITGQLHTQTDIFKLLSYYIVHVHTLNRNFVHPLANANFLQKFSVEYYYDLLNIHQCVSSEEH